MLAWVFLRRSESIRILQAAPVYIVCFVDPQRADVAKLKVDCFGGYDYIVQITDPIKLGQKLTDRLSELDNTDPFAGMIVECCRVRYDKYQPQSTTPSDYETFKLTFCQKPLEYSDECEVRLVS